MAEIRHWLQHHPATSAYVALDDMDLGAGPEGHSAFSSIAQHFVKTDPLCGLTEEDATKAIAILEQSTASEEDEEDEEDEEE